MREGETGMKIQEFSDTEKKYSEEDILYITSLVKSAIDTMGFHIDSENIIINQYGPRTLLSLNIPTYQGCKTYVYDYPFVKDENTGELKLKHLLPDHMMTDFHRERWKAMRRKAIHEDRRKPKKIKRHYDMTALGLWASRYKENNKSSVRYSETTSDDVDEIDMQAEIRMAGDKVFIVSNKEIKVPSEIPETVMTSGEGKFLGDLVELPSCGDERVDDLVKKELVYSIKKINPLGTFENTIFKVYGGMKYPAIPNESEWRKLREYRPLFFSKAPEYNEIDIEEQSAKYHQEIEMLLGRKTNLKINLRDPQ